MWGKSQAGPKVRQLEVGAQRAPILLVVNIVQEDWILKGLLSRATNCHPFFEKTNSNPIQLLSQTATHCFAIFPPQAEFKSSQQWADWNFYVSIAFDTNKLGSAKDGTNFDLWKENMKKVGNNLDSNRFIDYGKWRHWIVLVIYWECQPRLNLDFLMFKVRKHLILVCQPLLYFLYSESGLKRRPWENVRGTKNKKKKISRFEYLSTGVKKSN